MTSPKDERFYHAFTEKFRGSAEEIARRFWVYDAFIEPLAALRPGGAALDIGCGRGEFLGFLQARGLAPVGVDFDPVMLEAAQARGFEVVCADGLAHLESLPDDSQQVVASFHVIEHMTFDVLRRLVRETFRVLAPGGLVIFETPNPEAPIVSTLNFYYDPTHLRPLPPNFMLFMMELEAGARATILRLQQVEGIETRPDIGMTEALFNVSPDYAVIAQKPGDSALDAALDAAFSRPLGVDLYALTRRHDMYLDSRFDRLENALAQVTRRLDEVEATHADLSGLRDRLSDIAAQLALSRAPSPTAEEAGFIAPAATAPSAPASGDRPRSG